MFVKEKKQLKQEQLCPLQKVGTNTSNIIKINFIKAEIQFMTKLKERLQQVKEMAKFKSQKKSDRRQIKRRNSFDNNQITQKTQTPILYPDPIIEILRNKLQKEVKYIDDQIFSTYRKIDINSSKDDEFLHEQRILASYQTAVQDLNNRIEYSESSLQMRQSKKKDIVRKNPLAIEKNLGDMYCCLKRKIQINKINECMNIKNSILSSLKRKMLLLSKISKIVEERTSLQKKSLVLHCLRNNLSAADYKQLLNGQRYYRNKSQGKRKSTSKDIIKTTKINEQSPIKLLESQEKKKIKSVKNQDRMILGLQSQILAQQIQNLKVKNSYLQSCNENIKKGIQLRQKVKILSFLRQKQVENINFQEAIMRSLMEHEQFAINYNSRFSSMIDRNLYKGKDLFKQFILSQKYSKNVRQYPPFNQKSRNNDNNSKLNKRKVKSMISLNSKSETPQLKSDHIFCV